jgi:hypothetical protein
VDRLVREEGLEHLATVLDRVEALSGDELDALLAAEGAAR